MKIQGSIVALVTPFSKNNKLDLQGLKENIQYQLKNGTDGFVPCGTTGEAPTLTWEEWEAVVQTTIKTVNKKKPVIVGTGTNSTDKTIKLSIRAQELGADGCLIVTPYYNRPTQEGLFEHFSTIAREVKIPIIIYNIPARTGVNMTPQTVERLHKKYPEKIIGIKEASGNLDQVSEIIHRCGKDFLVFSGDDTLTLPILAIGGKGVISVVANIFPKTMARLIKYFFLGNIKRALELHYQLYPISKAMFIETNPAPIKFAMEYLGFKAGKTRLPLVDLKPENKEFIVKVLEEYQKGKKND
jgi:4-hydroxy-tetrahydrodipicolinate synthase